MREKLLLTVISFLVVCFFIPVQGFLDSYNIFSVGAISYDSLRIGVYTISHSFIEYDAETIAETYDMSQSWYVYPENYYAQKMDQVHTMNSNYRALVYRNIISIYDYSTDEWNLAAANGWLLKDDNGSYVISGVYPSNYLVDITNQSYQKWVTDRVKMWIDTCPYFDGVMVDNGLKYSAAEFDSCGSTRPKNPRTGSYFTDQEIADGLADLLNSMIDALGPSKLVMPNGIWNGEAFFGGGYNRTISQVPRLNSIFSEGTFFQSYSDWYYTETKWKQSVDMIIWIQDNFLSGHPERRFNAWVPIDSDVLPPNTSKEQLMTWGFCSILLGAKYSGQNTIGFGERISSYAELVTLSEKLHNADLGFPSNTYYKINSTSVYARDFTKGRVLVNPSEFPFTVTLDGSYTTLGGSLVSQSITINSHTGLMLFR